MKSNVILYMYFCALFTECDAGWEEYQGHCYLFESYLTSNLDDAIDRCDSRCARLIEIDSADEEAFVVSRVPDHLGFVQFLLDISFLDDVTIGFSPDHYLSDVDQTGYWNSKFSSSLIIIHELGKL